MGLANALKLVQDALARGDYNQSLESLEVLAKDFPLSSKEGAEIRILMVTALTGQGEEAQAEKAVNICQELLTHQESTIRLEAKQLLSILKAPSLNRPRDWSLTIPTISKNSFLEKQKIYSKQKTKEKVAHPATGPTKNLNKGFTILTISILIALTILLSGCVKVTTQLQITGPNRINLEWLLESKSNQLLPWQIEFANSFKNLEPKITTQTSEEGKQVINYSTVSSEKANELIKTAFYSASKSSNLAIESPELVLTEKNWLVGIDQILKVTINLKGLPTIPGLDLSILVNPKSKKIDFKSYPAKAIQDGSILTWEIQQNSINTLTVHTWQWSRLGLGALGTMLIMTFSLLLQNIRLKIGLGFPELPP